MIFTSFRFFVFYFAGLANGSSFSSTASTSGLISGIFSPFISDMRSAETNAAAKKSSSTAYDAHFAHFGSRSDAAARL